MTVITNIPRRKIYEKLADFEAEMDEMASLILNEKNFHQKQTQFNQQNWQNLNKTYSELKALIILFFENKLFQTEEEFENALQYNLQNIIQTNQEIKKNKTLTSSQKNILKETTQIFENTPKINTHLQAIEIFHKLDEFNTILVKIIEIRRDKMK